MNDQIDEPTRQKLLEKVKEAGADLAADALADECRKLADGPARAGCLHAVEVARAYCNEAAPESD